MRFCAATSANPLMITADGCIAADNLIRKTSIPEKTGPGFDWFRDIGRLQGKAWLFVSANERRPADK